MSYAASAVKAGPAAVKQLVAPSKKAEKSTVKGKNSKAAKSQGNKPGNPENAHTISVARSAVPAHLAHGDSEGACKA